MYVFVFKVITNFVEITSDRYGLSWNEQALDTDNYKAETSIDDDHPFHAKFETENGKLMRTIQPKIAKVNRSVAEQSKIKPTINPRSFRSKITRFRYSKAVCQLKVLCSPLGWD